MRLPPALSERFWTWMAKRAPRAPQVRLRHRSIYVLPTPRGGLFAVVIALLWLLGTNYENNLILGSAFLLLSLMPVSAVHAFRNLSGLNLSITGYHPAFAGESVEFDLCLQAAPGSAHRGLWLGWDPGGWREVAVPEGGELTLRLPHRAHRRGWLEPDWLRLESLYPLGLFRVWSWVNLEGRALVYPAPRSSERPPRALVSREAGERRSPDSREEFQGFRRYRVGEPLAHVAWKAYARGQGLWLKDFTGYESEQIWLDWDGLPGLDRESRLSRLCYWVLALGKTDTEYGLRLPGAELPIGRGPRHQARALRLLALYELPERKEGP